jgi:hypothetical protein
MVPCPGILDYMIPSQKCGPGIGTELEPRILFDKLVPIYHVIFFLMSMSTVALLGGRMRESNKMQPAPYCGHVKVLQTNSLHELLVVEHIYSTILKLVMLACLHTTGNDFSKQILPGPFQI